MEAGQVIRWVFGNFLGLTVIYGSRGAGKTTLILQLATELNNVALALPNRWRDVEKVRRFGVDEVVNALEFFEEDDSGSLLSAVLNIYEKRKRLEYIILDDPFPIDFLTEREISWHVARDIGLVISLLWSLIGRGKKVIITVHEHGSLPLPRRWEMFLELGASMYRLRKKFRIRELSRVVISGIPRVGEVFPTNIKPKIEMMKVVALKIGVNGRFIALGVSEEGQKLLP